MRPPHLSSLSALLLFLFLTACAGQGEETSLDMLRAAQSGMLVALERADAEETVAPLPAAIAGVMAGGMFSKMEDAAIPSPNDDEGGTSADTTLLRTLVELLNIDVQTLLNRATDRETKLDEYIASLESNMQQGQIRFRSMQDALTKSEDDKSRHERRVREIQNEMEDAINAGNASQVELLTQELIRKQGALGEAEAGIIVNENLSKAFEDVLQSLKERLQAIQANRNALLLGVTVVDIPGVDDLKIIKLEDGKIRVRSGSRGFLF